MTKIVSTVDVPAEFVGKIANSAGRYPCVPLYRTGETWLARYAMGSSGTYLIRTSDGTVHGPFGMLDHAETYVAENGGGYVDHGSSVLMIPSRPAGQIALIHKVTGSGLGPWWDWQTCEDRPRAFIACGHERP